MTPSNFECSPLDADHAEDTEQTLPLKSQSNKSLQVIHASAPGSMMFMGEHAVLRGHPALVCAVDKRIHVALSIEKKPEGKSPILLIHSELGSAQYGFDDLTNLRSSNDFSSHKPFHFVLSAFLISLNQNNLISLHQNQQHITLTIQSDFNHELGLGSSAAVTIAVLTACLTLTEKTVTEKSLIQQGITLIRSLQNGLGSGADVAASVLGGMVYLEPKENNSVHAEKLEIDLPLYGLYTGSKTPTVDVVTLVNEREMATPNLFKTTFDIMGKLTLETKEDFSHIPSHLFSHHRCQQFLGTSNQHIEDLKHLLESQPGIACAKISGSGLGDCLLALGRPQQSYKHWLPKKYIELGVFGFPVTLAQEGIKTSKLQEVTQ